MSQLGRKGELEFDAVTLGKPVSLKLRGVVDFTDVLIKIISTIDAELCREEKSESEFEQALRRAGRRDMLSADARKRAAQLASCRSRAAGIDLHWERTRAN